jgi:hypothetical protein
MNLTYLFFPPPFAGVHFVIGSLGLCRIKIVSLRSKHKCFGELRVPIERADALQNIPKIYIKCLSPNDELLLHKFWA